MAQVRSCKCSRKGATYAFALRTVPTSADVSAALPQTRVALDAGIGKEPTIKHHHAKKEMSKTIGGRVKLCRAPRQFAGEPVTGIVTATETAESTADAFGCDTGRRGSVATFVLASPWS